MSHARDGGERGCDEFQNRPIYLETASEAVMNFRTDRLPGDGEAEAEGKGQSAAREDFRDTGRIESESQIAGACRDLFGPQTVSVCRVQTDEPSGDNNTSLLPAAITVGYIPT
ncbi:hypothetical protein NHX12_005265 [Muraenolepis orangiensis]|uniref:Uncharacterized protein n=1 Tax=Muraenolepis orangiensis TaxID=630683 RepID=A0A9Q0DR91_9TELE|nr:hypothetical protein NHX12_005265 [Muraenolepis orangiensis]